MVRSSLACAACLRRVSQATLLPWSTVVRSSQALRLTRDTTLLALKRDDASRCFATAAQTAAAIAEAPAPPPRDLTTAPSPELLKKDREKLQRIVTKHLAHLEDPWKIAGHVEQTLAKGRFDEALLLTQRASKDRQVVVAWNHLIAYSLEQQQLKGAIKLYNDMKKRGQLPNVQTFTIIFRGCARSQHPKIAVAEAVKHYNLLLNDKRLKPNSIHLNAVLNVCARAGDLDSMFLVADTADSGARAPTAYTYTTILNALRHHVSLPRADGLSDDQHNANLQRTLDRAKGLWAEVVDKWSQARLVIDEELVCAMGRVLLLAPAREDKRAVLDLLQQTMSIPNVATSPESDPSQDSAMRNIAVSGVSKSIVKSKAVYAVPGRNTLALVLTTLASSKLTSCGIKYWNLMVRHYGVVPDRDNWLRMFGMLKVAKASANAAAILDLLPDEYVEPKPYHIAMETCVRDNINPNAVANATTVLDSMVTRLPVPDLLTLRLYLRVALVSHFHLRSKTRADDADKNAVDAAKRQYGVQITTALARLWEPYKKAHYHYFKVIKPDPADAKARGILYNDRREVIALARLMFSAFNKVANERMLPEKDLRELRPVGAKINREIQKFFSNREELEPKLRQSSKDHSVVEDLEGLATESTGRTGYTAVPGRDFIWNTTKTNSPGRAPLDSQAKQW